MPPIAARASRCAAALVLALAAACRASAPPEPVTSPGDTEAADACLTRPDPPPRRAVQAIFGRAEVTRHVDDGDQLRALARAFGWGHVPQYILVDRRGTILAGPPRLDLDDVRARLQR